MKIEILVEDGNTSVIISEEDAKRLTEIAGADERPFLPVTPAKTLAEVNKIVGRIIVADYKW